MGLAMWHTAELYEDIKYIASKENEDLYTALTNNDNQECGSKQDCHGKLIWKQREKSFRCFNNIAKYKKCYP